MTELEPQVYWAVSGQHKRRSVPRPTVLVFSGHDPTGGAGMQADIESVLACGARPVCVTTLATAQNRTQGVLRHECADLSLMREQTQALLAETVPQAIKIGALGSPEQAEHIHATLREHPQTPVVLDPVLAPTRGQAFADADSLRAIRRSLLPRTTLLTPNTEELLRLADGAPDADPWDALRIIHMSGCPHVLWTSATIRERSLAHVLSGKNGALREFATRRLPGEFHGSGCTLSSSIAAHLARRRSPQEAVARALRYTEHCLRTAAAAELPSLIPNRLP